MPGRLAVVAFLAAVIGLPSTATAAPASGRLVVLGARDQTVTLSPAGGRPGRVGRLTLLVRNESNRAVRLRVRFFADRGDVPIVRLRLPSDEAFPENRLALYTERMNLGTGLLVVRPRRTVHLPLRFGIAEKAKADLVTGLLVIAAQANPRIGSTSVRITGQLPAAAEVPKVAAQPPKLTVRVRRWLPGGLGEDLRGVDEPLIWAPGEKSDAFVLLSSGSGHSMKLKLADSEDHPPVGEGTVEQKLVVADLDAVGTYAGQLTLKPGGTDKIDVEAKVRDTILWPLLAVGIAAWIGGYWVTRLQRWRTRRILVGELVRAKDEYDERRPESPIGALDGVVAPAAVAQLTEEINAGQSSDELDELNERVRAVRSAVRKWIAIDDAARALVAVQDVPPDAGDARRDTEAALDATKWIPEDETAADGLRTRLRRQERIMRAFDAAYKRWPAAALAAYEKYKGASTENAKTAELIGVLDRVENEPEIIILMAEEERRAVTVERAAEHVEALQERFVGAAEEAGPESPRLRLTPEQIEKPVRRWDNTLAFTTFGLTVFLFVLGVYDDDFGTWEDYSKAFAAGLAGQVGGAALWNLFPALRSYRLLPKPAK